MSTQQPVLTTSVIAAADLAQPHRFVGFDGAQAGLGSLALGVLEGDTDAGLAAPVNVLGIVLVEAGAAIPAGSAVQSDASGRAIVLDAGAKNGVALNAAAAAGDIIRIVRGI